MITDTYRKYQSGKKIIFEDDSSICCADNHLMWIGNEWITANMLSIGQTIGQHQIKTIFNVDEQEWVDFSIDAAHESYFHNGILHHNSGKSLTIYTMIRAVEHKVNKILLLVPSITLVHQMHDDFIDYGFDSESKCHKIFEGMSKNSNKKIYISTWQSIYNNDPEYFEQFDMVIADECHLCSAKSLTTILNSCVNAKYRVGATGSLDESKTNEIVLIGLLGKLFQSTTTKKLIEKKQLTKLQIKCIVLKHLSLDPIIKKYRYDQEIDYLAKKHIRNQFITKLVQSLDGNTLVLFTLVKKHGNLLHEMFKKLNKTVYYIHGTVPAEDREKIRKIIDTEKNCIVLASYGTFSTGINAPNLHNIVFASAYKSKVKVIQSIGRGLRLAINKSVVTVYDIADDLRIDSYINTTLKHLVTRMTLYDKESFEYKIYKVKLGNKNENT